MLVIGENMESILKKEDIWALSITITGRCNCNCSYCHYYAYRDRDKYNFDMDENLFRNYVELIKVIQQKYHQKLQVRFSGGEPLVIGDKLFVYSNYLYQQTGLRPYVLTNGKALNIDIIKKAKKANISAFLVSVENPFDESEGAPSTEETLKKIAELDNSDVRVLPAVVVVKNKYFGRLKEICDLFYSKIHMLPVISELTFHAFQSPSQKELRDLYDNVRSIAEEYYGIAPIRIFPYISPELYASGDKNYLNELDIENTIGITDTNVKEIAPMLMQKLEKSYRKYDCGNKACDWYQDCKVIKWLWFLDDQKSSSLKGRRLEDYCSMKKAINQGLYDGIVKNRESLQQEN